MKLKLGEQDSVTILSLLLEEKEVLADGKVSVLRAGLTKLALGGKNKIILDLTQPAAAIATILPKLQALMGQIPDPKTPVELIIASTFGPVTSVGEGVEVLNSGLLAPMLQLDQLRARRDRLAVLQEKAKVRLTDLATNPVAIAIKDLKKRNAKAKRENRLLERILLQWRPQIRSASHVPTAAEQDLMIEKRETVRRQLQNLFVEKKYFEALDQVSKPESSENMESSK